MADRKKGRRTVDLVSDYVVVDLETTSRNINYAEIIEIAAIKVKDNKPIDTFSTLVQPEFLIPANATAVNGITNEMVVDAPTIDEVIGTFVEFVGDSVIVGHNITTYDINIIYDYVKKCLEEDFSNSFLDTLYMARACLCSLDNYRLGTIADCYGISTEGAHRALTDCYLTHECYQRMKDLCIRENIYLPDPDTRSYSCGGSSRRRPAYTAETQALQVLQGYLLGITADGILTDDEILGLKEWMDENCCLAGNYPFDVVMSSLDRVLEDGIIEKEELDYLLDLYKKFTAPVENAEHEEIISLEGVHCCVTGEFNYGGRAAVEHYIEEHGGICDHNVKKATCYVIVGSKGSDAWKHGNYGGKIKKAMELKEKGVSINIISEDDFFSEVEGEGE